MSVLDIDSGTRHGMWMHVAFEVFQCGCAIDARCKIWEPERIAKRDDS